MISRSIADISKASLSKNSIIFKGPLRSLRSVWSDLGRNFSLFYKLDDGEQSDLLNLMLIHLNRDDMMRFALALAEERAENADGTWAAQQRRGVVIVREIFRKVFPDGASIEQMLRLMTLIPDAADRNDIVKEMDRAEEGAYGEALSIGVSAFINGVPGYRLHILEKRLSGSHHLGYFEQIEIRMEPIKSALTDILFAKEKAYDREAVKRIGRQMSKARPAESPLSESYELLSSLCGYENWNRMSVMLPEKVQAA